MSISDMEEYPPLLEPGLYSMSMDELRQLYVEAFPLSNYRSEIMEGLQTVVNRLVSAEINGVLWVNGSFLTKKIDPNDVDIVLWVDAAFLDGASEEQLQTVDWINENLRDSHRCDSYVSVERSKEDPLYWDSLWDVAYWVRQFGFSRDVDKKGIATIKLLSKK